MKKLVIVLVVICALAYVFREKIAEMVFAIPVSQQMPCEVQGMSCQQLVRKLNGIRSGKYFEEAGKLLGVADTPDMYRDGVGVVFNLPDGTKLVHNQGMASREKGYLTVYFKNGIGLKFDDKGKFVSRM